MGRSYCKVNGKQVIYTRFSAATFEKEFSGKQDSCTFATQKGLYMANEKKKTDDAAVRIDMLSRLVIALIIGIIIGTIVSQVGLDALQERIQQLVVLFLWLIIITALFAFWVTNNKEKLLKKLFGVTDSDLSDIQKAGQSMLFNVVEKDYEHAKKDLSLLVRKAMAWYSWMNFRRWVVTSFQTLMVGLAGILGTIMLYNQNKLLTRQNELLIQQNFRLDQQTYLQEAERRSSLISLMSDILDVMNDELREDQGVKGVRDVSPQLIGRIIALSNSLRPYRYLGSDSLVGRELSPERGYLLLAIVSSEIDKKSLQRIYKSADFSFADLKKAELSGEYLAGVELEGAELEGAHLDEADLSNANLSEASLTDAVFARASLRDARLRHSDMRRAYFHSADLSGANLGEADLRRANFTNAQMTNIRLGRADLSGANLSGAILDRAAFDDTRFDSTIVSSYGWLDSLARRGPDTLRGTRHLTTMYRMDSVQTNLGWFYMLLRKEEE
jgi:uncharacterized protein YjbI with pentapeptide repeats